MFEIGKNYTLGNKTFLLFYFKYGKFFTLFSFGALFLAYSITYSNLRERTTSWLLANYDYVEVWLVAQWLLMFALSFFLVGFLRVWIMYRQYRFKLEKHAFHVKHGIFLIKEYIIPYHQIQNVEIRRPYLYAPFGLVEFDIILSTDLNVQRNPHTKKSTLIPVTDKKRAKALLNELIHRGAGATEETGRIVQNSIPSIKPRRRR
jgi:membrane protein YdbS with pleckstrin-like domain